MNHLRFIVIGLAALTSNLTGAPPTVKASLLSSQNSGINCTPAACKSTIKVKQMTTHQFELTPSQENALLSDATITVAGGYSFAFPLASDPNFENGDKSAKLKVVTPIPPPSKGSLVSNISAKWGNGKLTVRGIQTISVITEGPPPPIMPESQEKAVPTQTVTTTISNGGGTVVTVSAPVIVSQRILQYTVVSEGGFPTQKTSFVVKGNKVAP